MKFTTRCQLHIEQNKDLIDYFESVVGLYSLAKREIYQHYKHSKTNNESFSDLKTRQYLQDKYNITKRIANSIVREAKGIYNMTKESRKYQLEMIDSRITKLESKIKKKQDEILEMKAALTFNDKNIDLEKHRQNKQNLYALQTKLNKLKQRKSRLEYENDNGDYKICFGTLKLLKQNKDKHIKRRDSQMLFIGSKDETSRNQILQLKYNNKINQFTIKLRKGFDKCSGNDKYVYGCCHIDYQKDKIIELLNTGHSYPLTYRIIRKSNGRYYLYISFEIDNDSKSLLTRDNNGVIGIDFNKGFISYSEINKYGDLIDVGNIYYQFGAGDKTTNDLYNLANEVTDIALKTGKDIVIENLDFKKKKSKQFKAKSKQGKKYNSMLSSLTYKRFTKIMESVCYRKRVKLWKVSPAYTSKIAKDKFCDSKKLNIHSGASYVIGRRHQNYFRDRYKEVA